MTRLLPPGWFGLLGRSVTIACACTTLAVGAHGGVASEPGPPTQTTSTRMTVVDQTTWVEPDGEFALRLQIEDAPPGSVLVAELHDRVTGRLEFAGDLDSDPDGSVVSERCGSVTTEGIVPLDPCRLSLDQAVADPDGAILLALAFRSSAAAPADRILLREEGVYPLAVRLLDADGATVDRLVTHVIRLPSDGDLQPLPVSVLTPIDAPTARQPDGTTLIAAADREELDAIVSAVVDHPDLPLVLVPTPETLDALDALDALGTSTGSGSSETRSVTALAGALDRSQVLARPYVDLDVAAWWTEDLDAELIDQFTVGSDRVADLLETRPDRRTWLVEPTHDRDTLGQLRTIGVDQLIIPEGMLDPLPESLFPIAVDRPFTVTVGGSDATVPALLDDAALAAHVGSTGDPRLDAHHLLADLAVLYFQRPGVARGVAFSLPVDEAIEQPFVETLFDGLADASIVEAATVDHVLSTATSARVGGSDDTDGTPLVRTFVNEEPADLGTYPEDLRAAELATSHYQSLVDDDPDAIREITDHLRISGARDLDPATRDAHLATVDHAVQAVADGVQIPDQAAVTLTAREGLIPIRLQNDLGHRVAAAVRLESPKLEFPDGDTVEVVLEPGETRVEMLVRTRATGAFPVEVTMSSPDRAVVLDESRFTLRSTAVPGIGIALSVIAALFLATWWARHWRTARRAGRLISPDHPSRRADAQRARDELIDQIGQG